MCKFWNIFLLFLLFTSGGLVPLVDSFFFSPLFPPICYIPLLYLFRRKIFILLHISNILCNFAPQNAIQLNERFYGHAKFAI